MKKLAVRIEFNCEKNTRKKSDPVRNKVNDFDHRLFFKQICFENP